MTAVTPPPKPRRSLRAYLEPKNFQMLVLGFSSGLPFLLVGNTLSYWLRDEGTSLTVIAFIGWAALPYSFKPLWAPLIDRVNGPIFSWLGRRGSWVGVGQITAGGAAGAVGVLGL